VVSVPPETDPAPAVGKTYPVTRRPSRGKTDGKLTALEVTTIMGRFGSAGSGLSGSK
jgi:hypothetical protein